jgi:hypothetical protein
MGPTVKTMMRDCLVVNPVERPTLNDLSTRINSSTLDEAEYQIAPKGPDVLFPGRVAKALSRGNTESSRKLMIL